MSEPSTSGMLVVPNLFREYAGQGDMSVLEYMDANNECRHGWLPHERCRACASPVTRLAPRQGKRSTDRRPLAA